MRKVYGRVMALLLVGAMVLALLPAGAFAYSFTGQDYNVTKNITLNGVDTGADFTRVHLGSGGSSGWGANRYINIVEANLSGNQNLGFEVINHGSSIMGSSPLTSVVAGYSEDGNTILAAVNGDWMAYAKSIGIPVTKNYRVSFSSMLLDGEIWCSQMSEQEQFCDYYTFGVSSDRKVLIGKPYVSTTITNVSTGRSIAATGVNRAPADNAIYVYNNRMGSTNYVPADAYEIAISTTDNKFRNGGTVTGTVKGIYAVGSTSRCALDGNTVVITARGSGIDSVRGYFSVGQTVSVTTRLTASSNSSFWAKCEEATGGQCLVMQNGVVTNDLGASTGANSHQYPTSILGYRADGTVVMAMITADTDGKYVGLQFNRIPEFCKSLGYDTCLLLDGGGSTTMVTLEDGSYVERACYSDGVIRYTWSSLALVYRQGELIPDELKPVVFNPTYYASRYPDLKAAFGTNSAKLYEHFLTSGIPEGRQASPNFDIAYYVAQNEDLKAAYGEDYETALQHFILCGSQEVRPTAKPADIGAKLDLNVKVNGLYMGLSGSSVVTTASKSDATSMWTFTRNSDGSYTVINKGNGLSLDVPGGVNTPGTPLQVYTGNGSWAQKWYIYDNGDGTYSIQPQCTTTCVLDVTAGSTSAGAAIQIYTSNGTAAQRFTFEEVSKINALLTSEPSDLGTDFLAAVTGAASGKNLDSAAALTDPASTAAQLWRFVRHSDGSYELVNQSTGQVLDAYGGSVAPGTKVQTYPANGTDAQHWYLYGTVDGYVFLPRNSTATVLDAHSGLQLAEYDQTKTQLFNISYAMGDYMSTVGSTSIGTDFYAAVGVGSLNLAVSDTEVLLDGASGQLWKFELQPDGAYRITHKQTGLLLTAAADEDFAGVQIRTGDGSAAQQWYLYEKEGKYLLRSGASRARVLNASEVSQGAEVSICTANYSDGQLFSITVDDRLGEHTCVDADGDYRCDVELCGAVIPHSCADNDGDFFCDLCGTLLEHPCVDIDQDTLCDLCGQWFEHCVDANGDYVCDDCGAVIEHTCADADGDQRCDLCGELRDHTCVDADRDYWCDLCSQWYPHCVDANGDYWCEECGKWIEHVCVDRDNNDMCDYCYLECSHDCVDADFDLICDECGMSLAHQCTDGNGDYWCDDCGAWISHTCADSDRDYTCDLCGETLEHTCTDSNGDYWCDICGAWISHTCVDDDRNGACDLCDLEYIHECLDADGDYWCEGCSQPVPHDCMDDHEDYVCDLCGEPMPHDCFDEDGDYWCDMCGEWILHDCVDNDGNEICDYCYFDLSHDCGDRDGDYRCDRCRKLLAHDCMDGNGDYACDICGGWIRHICADADGNRACDYCFLDMTHDCMDKDGDLRCDRCNGIMPHDCVDQNEDTYCDLCRAYLCVDADGDYWCEDCGRQMVHECADRDRNFICDLCSVGLSHTCMDLNRDFICDLCRLILEHDCRDADGDAHCDVCNLLLEHECRDTDRDGFCDLCRQECQIEEQRLPGDINGDGRVNIVDVSRLYAHAKGSNPITAEELIPYCDLNGDGRVNIVDVSRLYAHAKGTAPL